MDFLSIIAVAGGPSASAIALACFYLLTRRDLAEVRREIARVEREHKACCKMRAENEKELHGRVTSLATAQAALKTAHEERSNGLAERIGRIERAANSHG